MKEKIEIIKNVRVIRNVELSKIEDAVGFNIHRFSKENNKIIVKPFISNNNLKRILFFLCILLSLLSTVSFFNFNIIDGLILVSFSYFSYFCMKKRISNKTTIISSKNIIQKDKNEEKVYKNDEIKQIEIFKYYEKKSQNVYNIIQLNVLLRNDTRINITTSSDEKIILESAVNIAKLISCDVYYDDREIWSERGFGFKTREK